MTLGGVISDTFDSVRLFTATDEQGWQSVRRVPLLAFKNCNGASALRDALEREIVDYLARVEGKTDWLLSVPPIGPDGFAVDLSHVGKTYHLLLGELAEEFELLADALTWLHRAVSGDYVLKVSVISGRPREWLLEPCRSVGDQPVLATGELVFFRSLRTVRVATYRNDFSRLVGRPLRVL